MKFNFRTILPIILISALLILLAGCFSVPTDESPGYTPGTITGIIAAPCCSTSAALVSETCCIAPEYWCSYCQKEWKLQDGIEVVLTYGEDEVATTTTNDKGEFTFTNVDPGKNFVVTAYCPDFADNRPLVKDVALQLIEGGSFNTNITDLVSTSLGLVVDFLVLYTDWGPEDISLDAVLADRPNFPNFPKFKNLVNEVRRVSENCEINLLTDEDVQDALCLAAEEISGLYIGCGAGYTPTPPPPGACDGNVSPTIDSVLLDSTAVSIGETVHVIIGIPYVITVNASDDGIKNSLTYSANIDGNPVGSVVSNIITIIPLVSGEFEIYINVNDGCTTTTWGPVTVVVDCPELSTLTLDISVPDPLCQTGCATINSATVSYTDTTPDLVITDLTKLTWSFDPNEIDFTPGTGAVCLASGAVPGTYTINATYEDECKETVSSLEVDNIPFVDCCIDPILDLLEFRVKLPSNGSDFGNWTGMFGYLTNPNFDSNTFYYDITTGESGSPKFGFRATGCDTLTLEYNWYRGESCTGDWLTGEADVSPDPLDDPPSWRPIVSAGIYPELDSENSLCNHGGNILKIKVTTTSLLEKVYTIVINRVVVP